MSKKVSVFNDKSVSHKTGNYPLIFGEELGLYDSVNLVHPHLFELYEQLKELDWSENDVDLTETRMDLLRCPQPLKELMTFNLAYQWELDSIATSLSSLMSPFVTNTEYGHLIARISENENLHSLTYSNIVRQCFSDPTEVFDIVYENNNVLERSETVERVLSELKEVGAKYTLGMIDKEDATPYVLKGIVAFYALERISFMSSFACTFALAQQEFFVGAARLVQKILIDESIHCEAGRYVLQDVLLEDETFAKVFEDHSEEMHSIIEGVTSQELNWNKYLFKGGRNLVGLNEGILNEWVRYNAQEVYDNLTPLKQPYRRITKDPLPWFKQDWLDLNGSQNANMESDATNYSVAAVGRDVTGVDFSDMIGFYGEHAESEIYLKEYLIYSRPDCPFCDKLKGFMEDNNLIYKEVNIRENLEAKEFLVSTGFTTVPQVFDDITKDYLGDCTKFISDNS